MAQASLVESSLRVVFETGINAKGEPVFKGKSYNNVKTVSTADQIFKVAQAIGSLSKDPISTVERNDHSEITA